MAEFDIDIRYKPGCSLKSPDRHSKGQHTWKYLSHYRKSVETSWTQPVTDTCHQELINQQQADNYLQSHMKTNTPKHQDRQHHTSPDAFAIIDGVLYYVEPQPHRLRLAVPKVLQQQLMMETHAGAFSGHFAARGMYCKLATQYWWKGMYTDIYHHCCICLTCGSFGS